MKVTLFVAVLLVGAVLAQEGPGRPPRESPTPPRPRESPTPPRPRESPTPPRPRESPAPPAGPRETPSSPSPRESPAPPNRPTQRPRPPSSTPTEVGPPTASPSARPPAMRPGDRPSMLFNVSVLGVRQGGCGRLRCRDPEVDVCVFSGETIMFHCQQRWDDCSVPVIMTPSGPAPASFAVNHCPTSDINGVYTCKCGGREESVRLQVYTPARIYRDFEAPEPVDSYRVVGPGSRRPVILRPGTNVSLVCPASGMETPKVAWFKRVDNGLVRVRPYRHGVALLDGSDFNFTGAILGITNVSVRDYGRYVCRTNNRAGEDEAEVVLAEPGVWNTGRWRECVRRREVACRSRDGQRELPRANCVEDMPSDTEPCSRERVDPGRREMECRPQRRDMRDDEDSCNFRGFDRRRGVRRDERFEGRRGGRYDYEDDFFNFRGFDRRREGRGEGRFEGRRGREMEFERQRRDRRYDDDYDFFNFRNFDRRRGGREGRGGRGGRFEGRDMDCDREPMNRDDDCEPMRPMERPNGECREPMRPMERPNAECREPMRPMERPNAECREPMRPMERPNAECREPMRPMERPDGEGREPMRPMERPGGEGREPMRPMERPGGEGREPMRPMERPGGENRPGRGNDNDDVMEFDRCPRPDRPDRPDPTAPPEGSGSGEEEEGSAEESVDEGNGGSINRFG